jgi:hypothetical protein
VIINPVSEQKTPQSKVSPEEAKEAPATSPAKRRCYIPGVEMSQQLYDMAGFELHQRVYNVTIK